MFGNFLMAVSCCAAMAYSTLICYVCQRDDNKTTVTEELEQTNEETDPFLNNDADTTGPLTASSDPIFNDNDDEDLVFIPEK